MFNLLSNLNVPSENYPFCTIDPNTARVPVPDDRFDFLVGIHKPKSVMPAALTITDIAGLVKGAHEGKGLGNEFLSHIAQVDGIYHLTRAFVANEIEHVEGSVEPLRDLEIISNELVQKDIKTVKTKLDYVDHRVKKGVDKTKEAKEQLVTLAKVLAHLENKQDVRTCDFRPNEIEWVNELQCLTAKSIVYLVNITEKNYETMQNKWIKDIRGWVAKRSPGAPVIPFSASWESKVSKMSAVEKGAYFTEKKIPKQLQTMIPKIISQGYHALDLVHFFTCGPDEVRAWTIRRGVTAPVAAGVIHSDFEKTFIAAETMSYDDFVKYGTEAACKAAGRYRTEGKAYLVKDGDILFFKAGSARKK
jgi:obg-like ATPase 1